MTALFVVEPAGPVERVTDPAGRGRRGQPVKRFREFDPSQPLLMSPVLDEWLPEGHLARFVTDLVDGVLDLGDGLGGQPAAGAFHPPQRCGHAATGGHAGEPAAPIARTARSGGNPVP